MQEITETQRVLSSMLVEPTGISILDSGGAYGRNWERNKDKTVQDFIDEPEVTANNWYPTLSSFHYCDHWLEFAEELDTEFFEWVEANDDNDSPWLVLMEEFADKKHYSSWQEVQSINTYNSDNILSQTLQYVEFTNEEDDERYVLLQIHGGCDVRGGYTKPRIFRCLDEGFGYDVDSYSQGTSDDRKGESVTIDFRHGEYYWVEGDETIGGYYTKNDHEMSKWVDIDSLEWDEENEWFICPDGDGHIVFYPNLY